MATVYLLLRRIEGSPMAGVFATETGARARFREILAFEGVPEARAENFVRQNIYVANGDIMTIEELTVQP